MTQQWDVIKKIDRESSALAEGMSAPLCRFPIVFLLRMMILPKLAFIRSMILDGGILKGVDGFTEAVNQWALGLATEAKLYERYNRDEMKKNVN